MALAWTEFALEQWATFSFDDWATFLVDNPHYVIFRCRNADVFRVGARAASVWREGAQAEVIPFGASRGETD